VFRFAGKWIESRGTLNKLSMRDFGGLTIDAQAPVSRNWKATTFATLQILTSA